MHAYTQDIEPTATPAGEFTDGDPILGIARTILKSIWPNMIQRELLAILAAAGIDPDANNEAQVIQSIQALINAGILTAITTAQSYVDHLPYGLRIGQIGQAPVNPGTDDTFTKGGHIFAELKGQDFLKTDYSDAWAFAATWYDRAPVWATRATLPGLFAEGPELILPSRFAVPDVRGLVIRSTGGNAAAVGAKQEDAIRNITGTYGAIPQPGSGWVGATGAFTPGPNTGGSDTDGGGPTGHVMTFNASNVVPTAEENRMVNTAWPWIIRLT